MSGRREAVYTVECGGCGERIPVDGPGCPRCALIAGVCRVCGCTDDHACLLDARTGELVDVDAGDTLNGLVVPCSWVEPNLCSGCVEAPAPAPLLFDADGQPLRRGSP